MKKLLLITILSLGVSTSLFAQVQNMEDIISSSKPMIDKEFQKKKEELINSLTPKIAQTKKIVEKLEEFSVCLKESNNELEINDCQKYLLELQGFQRIN